MQWVWRYCHRLSTQNTSCRKPSDTSQISQRSPCKIEFEALLWRQTGEANPDHSPTIKDIAAWVIIEATLDHNTGIDAPTTEAAHDDLTQPTEDTATDLTVTHCTCHITDPPNIEALWATNPEFHSKSHSWPSYWSSRHGSCGPDSYSSRTKRRPDPKKNMKMKIEDLHTYYYSSHDHSSGLGEESDHLN